MDRRNRHHGPRPARRGARGASPALKPVPTAIEKPAPVVYGKPFLVLEDANKNVFIVQGAQLVPQTATIADYRRDSRVKQFPQKIKGLTRYEICSPVSSDG